MTKALITGALAIASVYAAAEARHLGDRWKPLFRKVRGAGTRAVCRGS